MSLEIPFTEDRRRKLSTASPECKAATDSGESISAQDLLALFDTITDPAKKEECIAAFTEGQTTTQEFLKALKSQLTTPPAAAAPTPTASAPANGGGGSGGTTGGGPDGYRRGPLKEAQDPKKELEILKGTETAAKMGETIKQNITLLHTRIRENYIRHFDDALLGSVINFRDEYEHHGRILTNGLAQIGTPGFTIDADKGSGDNVVNYSNKGASALIDLIVSQYGNGKSELEFQRGFQKKAFSSPQEKDKAILEKLQEINEGLVDEDGWLGLAIGLPIAVYISAKVTLPIMKWSIGRVPFVGKPALALTSEVYEKLERAAKGVGSSGKSLAQSVKDRLKAQKAEGAPATELTPEQKKLKEVQIEGAKEVVKEYLFEKYGKSYANYDAFVNDLDSGGMANTSEIRRARQEMHSLGTTIGKHLPVDVTVMDGWELEMKLRQIGLDMPLGVWGRMKNGFYRFIFEKGSIANLVFQNKYVRLSERTNSGIYTDRVSTVAGGLNQHFDRVEIEHNGEKILVSRTDATMIQEVMKHVDAQIAIASIHQETALATEIHTLEEEIKKLKADNIPDSEQGVKDMEAKLQDLIAQHDAYTTAENLESQKKGLVEQKDVLAEHKRLLEEYRTQYDAQSAARGSLQEAITKGQAIRKPFIDTMTALSGRIGTLENGKNAELKGIMEAFAREAGVSTTDRFSHFLGELQAAKGRYNLSGPSIAFDPAMESLIQTAEKQLGELATNPSEGAIKGESAKVNQVESRLRNAVDELKGEGLWDDANNKPTKTKTQIDADIRTLTSQIGDIDTKIRHLSGTAASASDPLIREADGSLKPKPAIEARRTQVQQMGKHIADKGEKAGKAATAAATRMTTAERTGVTQSDAEKLKPKAGSLDVSGQAVLDSIIQKAADTQGSFDAWKARINPRYTIEYRDGKLVIKDGIKVEGILDPSNPKEAAKLLEKFGRR